MADELPSSVPPPTEPATPEPTPARPAGPRRASAFPVLFRNAARSWFSAKGFILVLVATLLPVILAGAWIGTHQRDVAVTSFDWGPQPVYVNQPVTFNATVENPKALTVGNFTVTFQVIRFSINPFTGQISRTSEFNQTVDAGGLAPGERRTLNASWTPRTAGVYGFLVEADPDWQDKVAEIDEYNNYKQAVAEIQFGAPGPGSAPRRPEGLAGNATAPTTVDLAVQDLRFEPDVITSTTNATFVVTVVNRGSNAVNNASLTLRLGEVFGGVLSSRNQTVERLDLLPGDSRTVRLAARDVPPGAYWSEAFVSPPPGAKDANPSDNYANRSLAVAGSFQRLDPPEIERRTIKEFYVDILGHLTLPIVLPLIALFYAAGAISDERERGNLTYLLTRPFGRGGLPLVKFLVGFIVAAVAVLVGVAAMYLVLLGTPERDPGYLVTPLAMSLLSLFVYGAFFTFLAVIVNRAYLTGVAFVLGWEVLIPVLINLNLLNDDTRWFTASFHLQRILSNWPLDQLVWFPTSSVAIDSITRLVIAGGVFLGLAYWMMRGREFEA